MSDIGDMPENDAETGGIEETVGGGSKIRRDAGEVRPSRRALVGEIQNRITNARKRYLPHFKHMRDDMELALRGADKKAWDDDKYVANIVHRHVQQRVAALYARNPRAIARRKEKLDFEVWDGRLESAIAAQDQITEMQGQGVPARIIAESEAGTLISDLQAGLSRREMLDRTAKTLELVYAHQLEEQTPSFKLQMKQLVRRTAVTGVGYVKLGYQRTVGKNPITTSKLADLSERLQHMERIAADVADGEIGDDQAESEELRLAMRQLQSEPDVILREGLTFDFPASTSIIVDPMCRNLRGFIGARWVAHEMYMSPDEVKEVYEVDLGHEYAAFKHDNPTLQHGIGAAHDEAKDTKLVCVWEYYDRKSGLMYTLVDGYPDFLTEPEAPPMPLERFFPIYVLTFNEIEHENELFPPSDVSLIRNMQAEYNRARQSLREHRQANRPHYVTPAGALEEEDKAMLAAHPANGVTELQGLAQGQRISDIMQHVPVINIDPNLYLTNHLFDDVQLVVGAQEAHFGQISGGTATETSIAENSRMSTLASSIDDLDDMFTDIARDSGQILLMEMDAKTVKEIAGPGAVWPELSRREIASELALSVEAGSTGRPNKAVELNNLQTAMPFLLQIPGINPRWLAEMMLTRLDETFDLTDALIDDLPSIMKQNGEKPQKADTGGANPGGNGQAGFPAPGTGADPNAIAGAVASMLGGAAAGGQGQAPVAAAPVPSGPQPQNVPGVGPAA